VSLNTIVHECNNSRKVVSILYDGKKAFDSISRIILLEKLYIYGIRGKPLNWIKTYLENRKQQVVVNNKCSNNALASEFGILQGSVLSATLFLIYINDFITVGNTLSLLYADDSHKIEKADTLSELKINLAEHLPMYRGWFSANNMAINDDKTCIVLYRSTMSADFLLIDYNSHSDPANVIRPTTNFFRNLGFWTNHKLETDVFFEKIIAKAQFGAYALSRVKNTLPQQAKLCIFNAFVQSHLEFASLYHSIASAGLKKKLYKIQKRAIRNVICAPHLSHTPEFF